MFSFTIEGINELQLKLASFNKKFLKEVDDRFVEVSDRFINEVKTYNMSGRPGLIERSGFLKSQEKFNVERKFRSVETTLFNDTIYHNVHEYGHDFGNRVIPKRLHKIELIDDEYVEYYYNSVLEAFSSALGGSL